MDFVLSARSPLAGWWEGKVRVSPKHKTKLNPAHDDENSFCRQFPFWKYASFICCIISMFFPPVDTVSQDSLLPTRHPDLPSCLLFLQDDWDWMHPGPILSWVSLRKNVQLKLCARVCSKSSRTRSSICRDSNDDVGSIQPRRKTINARECC